MSNRDELRYASGHLPPIAVGRLVRTRTALQNAHSEEDDCRWRVTPALVWPRPARRRRSRRQ